MTHRRTAFIVYPSGYEPGDGYKVRLSKRQAWKAALRMGAGARVDRAIYIYERPRTRWVSSSGAELWVVEAAP